ncbi:AbrB family transcriptional regulator [Cohnella lubricantis]|uniref:AbrB family transcriptional regulator n=1 Tax=Cohnella lubricantis TaxID=2163172 RepID=A0A841T606_9BACL|nr:AbrB family transcriptional regulator [Cohnella lubricantis]MBB6676312.1 AbrB family transcriptional regulator [Cohnella lubricantis]MBP2119618.1 membrane AbrB-like protein [Cohnella lubricantis]
MIRRFLITLAISLAGGFLFTLIRSPLPWLLGPMLFTLIGSRLMAKAKIRPLWPGWLRNSAMIAIGYAMGSAFTMETLREMGHQLPTMLLMNVLLLLFCALIALGVAKLSGQSYPTVLMGCIPGGLSQMILLAGETPGINVTVMTFLQVSRLLMIIFCVPMLIFSPVFGGTHQADTAAAAASSGAGAAWSGLFPDILLFAAVCVAVALLAQKIKFPSAFLLGPMIATAALFLSGVHGPALPTGILDASQLLIGTYVGLLLRPERLENKTRTIVLTIMSGLVLIGGSLGLSALLTQLHGSVSPATAFLSMAPGGMDQMALMAREVHADLAIVSCYQIFRLWFIFFVVPPLLRLAFKRLLPRKSAGEEAVGES